MKRFSLVAVAAAVAAASVAAFADGTDAARTVASCSSAKIGFMGPITGDAAFIGKEQRDFAKYAIRKLGGGKLTLVEGDTQLDPAQASTVGQRFASDSDIIAIIGPAGSQEVLAVAPIFRKAGLAFISGSATRTSLTNGKIPTFKRVVPNDSIQAPTDARYISRILKAKNVLIIDEQTAYSVPLANAVQANLRAAGVKVTRKSVNQKVTDFTSLITGISDDVTVIFLPWQIAANAQVFGQQLKEQGKSATIFGSDGLDSGDFKIDGSYVSAFAPDIKGIKANAKFVREYGKKFVTTFGPPNYVAGQALIQAINRACTDGTISRAEVVTQLKKTFIPKSILGGNIPFTPKGDVKGAKFYIFKLTGGKKVLVG